MNYLPSEFMRLTFETTKHFRTDEDEWEQETSSITFNDLHYRMVHNLLQSMSNKSSAYIHLIKHNGDSITGNLHRAEVTNLGEFMVWLSLSGESEPYGAIFAYDLRDFRIANIEL